MAQENAARFFKSVKQDEALKAKLKAITDPESFIKIAEQHGYHFTTKELQAAISKLSDEGLAAVVNPGVAPRSHILPR